MAKWPKQPAVLINLVEQFSTGSTLMWIVFNHYIICVNIFFFIERQEWVFRHVFFFIKMGRELKATNLRMIESAHFNSQCDQIFF